MIIVDTGPIYAAFDADDEYHKSCAALLSEAVGPLIVPSPVLTEVCYLLEKNIGGGSEAPFLRSLASGEMRLEEPTLDDLNRMAELVTQYKDMPLGAADASVIAIAERLGATDIATVDRRHFYVVRPKHTTAFNLLPYQL